MSVSPQSITQEEASLLYGEKRAEAQQLHRKTPNEEKIRGQIWKDASLLHRCCFKKTSEFIFVVASLLRAWKYLSPSTFSDSKIIIQDKQQQNNRTESLWADGWN